MKNKIKLFFQNQLKFLVTKLLEKNHPVIIAITGSIAKSSTKEAIYQVLCSDSKYKNFVLKSPGNLNTEIGVPLAILGFNKSTTWLLWLPVIILSYIKVFTPIFNPIKNKKILVLEFAADKPGDISYLMSFIKPNIGIVTIIGPAHFAQYKSLKEIALEKAQLVYRLGKDCVALLNRNDQFTDMIVKNVKAKIVFFESEPRNLAITIAQEIAEIYQINNDNVNIMLKNCSFLAHRLDIVEKNDFVILDDSYNANPLSMQVALEELNDLSKKYSSKRKIAVLGDMLELGSLSHQAHQAIIKFAKENADMVIVVGKNFAETEADRYFHNSLEVIPFILNEVKKNDIILVKGSHSIKMDMIVEALKKMD